MNALEAPRGGLADGGQAFSGWTTLGGCLPGEILAGTGFDYVRVDPRRGIAGLESVALGAARLALQTVEERLFDVALSEAV